MSALEPNANSNVFTARLSDNPRGYRRCTNYAQENVCNWTVPVEDGGSFCRSCELNEVIPNLLQPEHQRYWAKIESAKRRVLYTLYQLGLPVNRQSDTNPHGLAFKFLADATASTEFTRSIPGMETIRTGHANGVITINLAEADDVARTRERERTGEAYRTLTGHFRHELGHYYWTVLIQNSPHLDEFRQLFGDETFDYGQALKNYHQNGPPQNWRAYHISAYCTAHPHEDWAETWAHYLHMVDTLETAESYGISIENQAIARGNPSFDQMLFDWRRLSVALNALNRSMGMPDAYPFVLNPPVERKLTFVHHVIQTATA